MNENEYKVIVLRPIGRSGSYFIQNLFDGHPRVLVLPFPFPFYYHWKMYHQYNKNEDLQHLVNHFISETSLKYMFDGYRNKYSKYFSTYTNSEGQNTYFELSKELFESNLYKEIEKISDHYPSRKAFLIAVHVAFEKSVGNNADNKDFILINEHYPYQFEDPDKDFEKVYNLLMIREPLNCYASYCKSSMGDRGMWGMLYTNLDLNLWIDVMLNAKLHSEKFPQKIYFLKTEDLNLDPKQALQKLTDWLDMEFNEVLLEPTYVGFDKRGISLFNKNQTGFDPEIVTEKRWESYCSKREVIIVNSIFRDFIQEQGYQDRKIYSKLVTLFFIFLPDFKVFNNRYENWKGKVAHVFLFIFITNRVYLIYNLFRSNRKKYIEIPFRSVTMTNWFLRFFRLKKIFKVIN